MLAAVLAASLLPLAGVRAQTGPQIEFLNPSGYTTNFDISDKPDRDSAVHLVAWVANVPSNPLVEFEISSPTTTTSTIDAERAGTDSWEAFLQIASLVDGEYTLRASLFKDCPGATCSEVDTVTRTVTVRKDDDLPPPAPNTVEMTYPDNGGPFGVFAPKGKRVTGVIDTIVSDGTRQVRSLYTTSAPGTAPTWTACGFARVPTDDNNTRVRCTLAEGAAGSQVTGVAVIANDTLPPADPNMVADATGDAHRVFPYTQLPRVIDITPESAIADPNACFRLVAALTDQSTRPIAGANLDVHVVGPDDQIRFGNIPMVTDEFQPPDKGHVAAARPAINCANKENQGMQGDHNIPGEDDPQHIESVPGTTNSGQFTFTLLSASLGGSQITVWADVDDDDTQQLSEASGGSRLGWGQPPPEASREIFLDPVSSTAETGSCQRVEVAGKLSGNPMSGQNVDIHITGPDESASFCLPPDGDTGTAPDGGTHTGNADDATTRHLEGQLDGNGRFVFGLTSATPGSSTILAWADLTEDDVKGTDEASKVGAVDWTTSGERSISIQSNKQTANKGSRVRISGSIDGASACESGQTVKLKAKRLNRGTFRTIGRTTTAADGSYTFSVVVRVSKKYRTVAPVDGACEKAISRVITVRAN